MLGEWGNGNINTDFLLYFNFSFFILINLTKNENKGE